MILALGDGTSHRRMSPSKDSAVLEVGRSDYGSVPAARARLQPRGFDSGSWNDPRGNKPFLQGDRTGAPRACGHGGRSRTDARPPRRLGTGAYVDETRAEWRGPRSKRRGVTRRHLPSPRCRRPWTDSIAANTRCDVGSVARWRSRYGQLRTPNRAVAANEFGDGGPPNDSGLTCARDNGDRGA
jgi:hypothetical protein